MKNKTLILIAVALFIVSITLVIAGSMMTQQIPVPKTTKTIIESNFQNITQKDIGCAPVGLYNVCGFNLTYVSKTTGIKKVVSLGFILKAGENQQTRMDSETAKYLNNLANGIMTKTIPPTMPETNVELTEAKI